MLFSYKSGSHLPSHNTVTSIVLSAASSLNHRSLMWTVAPQKRIAGKFEHLARYFRQVNLFDLRKQSNFLAFLVLFVIK